MTQYTSSINLPFQTEGWNQKFEVCERVKGNWINKGEFTGENSLRELIRDKFFEGREIAVFHQGEIYWTNMKKE